MDTYYVNGDFVSEQDAKISVNDLSVLRGFGVFDFLRTYSGLPFHLDDHLVRLERSSRLIGLQLPQTLSAIREIVLETLSRNSHPESNIRIVATGGLSPDGITPGNSPLLMVMVTSVTELPTECFTKGSKVITSHVERFMPGAKSINYIPAILCQAEARSRQAIDSIYVDKNGYLLEGTTSNIFAFCGNTLITPPCSNRVLPGVTRQVTLELAKKHFTVIERDIHKDEIRLLDEAFITSSVREVAPIIEIDAITIGDGRVGSQTNRVMELFAAYTTAYKG